MKKLLLFLGIYLMGQVGMGQNAKLDSLHRILATLKPTYTFADTLRVQILNQLAFQLRNVAVDRADQFADEATKLAEKIAYQEGLAVALGYKGLMAYRQGKYDFAITHHHRSLQIALSLKDSTLIAFRYNDLANVYFDKGELDRALEYNLKSLEIKQLKKDKVGIATSWRNLGMIYFRKKDYENAISLLEKSKELAKEIKEYRVLAYDYGYLGGVYTEQGNYEKAFVFLQKALEEHQKIDNKYGVVKTLIGLGRAYSNSQNFSRAEDFFQEALKIAHQADLKLEEESAYLGLSRCYEKQKKYDKALLFYQKYTLLKDSLFDEKKEEHINFLEVQFENEKKQTQINLLTKEQAIQQKEIEKERLLSNIFLILILFAILVALALSYNILQKRRINEILTQQRNDLQMRNLEVSQQKEKISSQTEELQKAHESLNKAYKAINYQNKDITASITYAFRIQNGIMPKEKELQEHFDCFVFFRPKDIVSGDFYWFADKDEKKILAVADCTGHGVSGAFMTMIGNNILNKIVHDYEIHEPDEILDLMPIFLEKTLFHAEGNIKDSMDIAIVVVEKRNKLSAPEATQISYAGAMNPLYYVENRVFKEIKADKVPLGAKNEEEFSYQKHELIFAAENHSTLKNSNPTFYLCSDGFQDQFGGTSGRKFMVKKFKQTLLDISDRPMIEQKILLDDVLDIWKGNEEQTDDILIVGFRFL